MAEEPAHSPLAPEPSDRKVLFSALGWLGVIFIFVLIVLIAYVPNQAEDLESQHEVERKQIRAQVEAEQEKNATTYQWVNQAEGRVQLPLARARELVVQELQSGEADG